MPTVVNSARCLWFCLGAPLLVLAGSVAAPAAENTDFAPLVEFCPGTGPASAPVPAVVPAASVPVSESAPAPMAVPPVTELNWRALGPLFERRGTPTGERELRAFLRPLYTDFYTTAGTTSGRDILWPLGFTRNRPDSEFQFFLPFLHTRPHHGTDGVAADRWWLMPVVFYGHDNEAKPYFGLFPLGGRIGPLFGFERVEFWLFPLYVESHKKTFVAHTWLWPVYSRTTGECVDKFRVWPLYGRALFYGRSPETTAKWLQSERHFYAWPLVHTNHIHPRPGDPAGKNMDAWFVLPFCGKGRQTDAAGNITQKTWTVLWPFFSGENCTIPGQEKKRIYCPWPFVRLEKSNSRDGREDKLNYWPFYGREQKVGHTTGYVLWPFWSRGEAAVPPTATRTWSALIPVWWSSELWRKAATEPQQMPVLENNFKQIWPLFSYDREKDKSRLAVLALWPRRAPDGVSRNYAPLWTLYSRERAAGEIRHEALWGWWKLAYNAPQPMRWSLAPFAEYHREDDQGGWYFSLGKGLLGWHRTNGERHGRALWVFKW